MAWRQAWRMQYRKWRRSVAGEISMALWRGMSWCSSGWLVHHTRVLAWNQTFMVGDNTLRALYISGGIRHPTRVRPHYGSNVALYIYGQYLVATYLRVACGGATTYHVVVYRTVWLCGERSPHCVPLTTLPRTAGKDVYRWFHGEQRLGAHTSGWCI